MRVIKETEEHSNILDQENHILKQEIDNLNKSAGDVHDPGSEGLYEKLKRECEALELLTYLQYAD